MLALRVLCVVVWTVLVVAVRRALGRRRHPDWSWRLELVAEIARWAAGRTTRVSLERVRRAMPAAPLPARLARRVSVQARRLGRLAAEQLTPAGWKPSDPTLLWLHGGGYVICSSATHRELVARLARAAGARAIVLDYRLAPEHPFPAALDDGVDALEALLAEGVAPGRLVLGGDSAGGGLALAALIRQRDAGRPLPALAVLFSPWVDLTRQGPTIAAHAPYDYVRADLLAEYARLYLGSTPPDDPLASPLGAQLAGLPPLLVQTGGAEALYWENEQLVARARAAGVTVRHEVLPGLVHVTQGFARFLPEARAALRSAGRFVRSELARQRPARTS